MNKHQKALDWFMKWQVVREKLKDYNFYNEVKVDTPLEVLQELVDKETPTKGLYSWNTMRHHCPKCKEEVRFNRCHECGQKIDWGKEDEEV